MDKFDAMRVFVRVVERGSFSAVSRELGIGQPAVSKQISALEEELGAELIHRTSRSFSMTEAGRDFYESSLRILDDFETATSRIGRVQTAPKGLIRVTAPPTFARLHMVSKLPAFFAAGLLCLIAALLVLTIRKPGSEAVATPIAPPLPARA